MQKPSKQPGQNLHLHPSSKRRVFSREGKITYRIPALIYTSDCQTFFAFAEKRKTEDDSDADVLVMSRGKRVDGKVEWSSPDALATARLEGYRTMNPCPIYKSNKLFLFFICVLGNTPEHEQIQTGINKARLCYISSADHGKSWTKITDLTESVIGDEIANWATFAVGPGHGIQLKSGRLIVPAYVYYTDKRSDAKTSSSPCTTSCAMAFYSDDDGKTWKMGEKMKTESNECQMAELFDEEGKSHLYCNARTKSGHRVEAWSKSSGIVFDRHYCSQELVETGNGCQGSVLAVHAQDKEKSSSASDINTWLLHSHPSDNKSRKNLAVYLNKTPLKNSFWSKPLIIHNGPSGYSDLTQCEDSKSFACLMECGEKSECEGISFVEFTYDATSNK
ncbi:sialidase-3-like [Hoplias malabaricus]|uniref:sialidase-3-like n=1 Tax=Hoplias malabaricus TaxID=27720 RepID=UPI003461F48A